MTLFGLFIFMLSMYSERSKILVPILLKKMRAICKNVIEKNYIDISEEMEKLPVRTKMYLHYIYRSESGLFIGTQLNIH